MLQNQVKPIKNKTPISLNDLCHKAVTRGADQGELQAFLYQAAFHVNLLVRVGPQVVTHDDIKKEAEQLGKILLDLKELIERRPYLYLVSCNEYEHQLAGLLSRDSPPINSPSFINDLERMKVSLISCAEMNEADCRNQIMFCLVKLFSLCGIRLKSQRALCAFYLSLFKPTDPGFRVTISALGHAMAAYAKAEPRFQLILNLVIKESKKRSSIRKA